MHSPVITNRYLFDLQVKNMVMTTFKKLSCIINIMGKSLRGFKPGRGWCIFSEGKSPEYDFLRKGSKAVGPMS